MTFIALLFPVLIILIIWLGVLSFFAYKTYVTYRALTKDIDKDDLALVLRELKKQQNNNKAELEKTFKEIELLRVEMKPHIQQLGFVRYNPFGNTGGDQSFSLCLLDGRGDGILVTSLHARQQTRIYTKEIINNKPKDEAELSKEEEKCLNSTKKWSST